jgi:dolichyl-phosphate-mannose--protein O-mannosyl transferase
MTTIKNYFDPILTIAGSLTFVAGMAWNNAFSAVFDTYLSKQDETTAKFVYAISVTIITVLIIMMFVYINKFTFSNKIAEKMYGSGRDIDYYPQ